MRKVFVKKGFIVTILLLVLGVFTATLSACGGGSSTPPNTDSTIYSVSFESSPYFRLSGTRSATAGGNATVYIDLNYSECSSVAGVQFNGQNCTKVSDTEYSYIMPAEDVEITVTLAWLDYSEPYGRLSWNSENETTILSAKGDLNYDNDDCAELNFSITNRVTTSAEITILSTNETVIPTSAITYEFTCQNMSSIIIGGNLKIDRSLINAGSTQIVFTFESDNSSGYDYTIVATITVNE